MWGKESRLILVLLIDPNGLISVMKICRHKGFKLWLNYCINNFLHPVHQVGWLNRAFV